MGATPRLSLVPSKLDLVLREQRPRFAVTFAFVREVPDEFVPTSMDNDHDDQHNQSDHNQCEFGSR